MFDKTKRAILASLPRSNNGEVSTNKTHDEDHKKLEEEAKRRKQEEKGKKQAKQNKKERSKCHHSYRRSTLTRLSAKRLTNKELRTQNAELKNENAELNNENAELKKRVHHGVDLPCKHHTVHSKAYHNV